MSVLRIAELRGDARARGRAHAELFAADVRASGILDFYLGYCERFVPGFGVVARPGFAALHAFCARGQGEETRGLVRGFSEASGLPEGRVARALVMPDVLNYIAGLGASVSAALGCTSVAAWGPYTAHGRLLYGRNLDFAGNGYWDKCPLLLRHKPERGLPYVSLTTAGGLVDGITGINAEGLSVALHQHLSREVSLRVGARPVLDLGLEALRTCRTIEQAVDLAAGWPTSSGWTLVLTNWKQKAACAVERTPRRVNAVWARDGVFARTNDFADPGLVATEVDYTCWRQSSRVRLERARSMLEAGRGRLDAAGIAAVLSDHLDAERGIARAFAQAIASPSNMTSVIFDGEAGCLYAAEGPAPVCDAPYRRIGLWDDGGPCETLPASGQLTDAQRRGYAHYLEGMAAFENRADEPAAARALAAACAADPEDPAYRYMLGLFSLRLGDAREAAAQLERGMALPDLPHRQRAQRLWLARSLDASGRRAEASGHYRALAEAERGRALGAAAQAGLRRPYSARKARAVVPDMFFADVYAY